MFCPVNIRAQLPCSDKIFHRFLTGFQIRQRKVFLNRGLTSAEKRRHFFCALKIRIVGIVIFLTAARRISQCQPRAVA